MEFGLLILGLLAALALVKVVRTAMRGDRPSIRAMLDDSQPCAVRTRP